MRTLSEVVQDVLANLEKRVQNKVIEPENQAILKKLIEKAETADEAIKIAELGTTYKRTGFHFDPRLEPSLGSDIRYFKRNQALSFTQNPTDITHKLIIGDNYPALLNLLIQYRNCVDVIYIDPPYGADSMGEYAQTNYKNNITRDNLLSMLYPRLVLAKQLLSDSGVIFCSIDDRNQAYVKCLFDEVFEERNFVGTMIHRRAKGGGMAKNFVNSHDYIHVYAKCLKNIDIKQRKIVQSKVVNRDGETYFVNDDLYRRKFGGKIDKNAPHRCFFYEEIEKVKGIKEKQFIDEQIKQGNYFLKPFKNGQHLVARYEKVSDSYSKVFPIIEILSEEGNREVLSIFNQEIFSYPKPVNAIKFLVEIASITKKEKAVVLDFFAGSGTTGQAVLESNRQDGGKRQYICVQLNEDLDKALLNDPKNQIIKNQIALCDKYRRPHELSEITAERLRRVMTGKCYDGSTDFEWNKKNAPLGGNLEVCNIATVSNFETTPKKTAFDVIDETLYGQEPFATVQEKVEWVCNNFENTQKQLEAK